MRSRTITASWGGGLHGRVALAGTQKAYEDWKWWNVPRQGIHGVRLAEVAKHGMVWERFTYKRNMDAYVADFPNVPIPLGIPRVDTRGKRGIGPFLFDGFCVRNFPLGTQLRPYPGDIPDDVDRKLPETREDAVPVSPCQPAADSLGHGDRRFGIPIADATHRGDEPILVGVPDAGAGGVPVIQLAEYVAYDGAVGGPHRLDGSEQLRGGLPAAQLPVPPANLRPPSAYRTRDSSPYRSPAIRLMGDDDSPAARNQ